MLGANPRLPLARRRTNPQDEEENRTIEIPFSLQRRAGSFQILPFSTGGRVVSMGDPSLIKSVVRRKGWAYWSELGGGGEIRTRGPLRAAGFQDRCIRPLCHPSDVATVAPATRDASDASTLPCRELQGEVAEWLKALAC